MELSDTGINLLGYHTSLDIRADGTFTKCQSGRISSTTFKGKYYIDKEGRITFHVQSRLDESEMIEMITKTKPQPKPQDDEYVCRCAVDNSGYLILSRVGMSERILRGPEDDSDIRWEGSYKKWK